MTYTPLILQAAAPRRSSKLFGSYLSVFAVWRRLGRSFGRRRVGAALAEVTLAGAETLRARSVATEPDFLALGAELRELSGTAAAVAGRVGVAAARLQENLAAHRLAGDEGMVTCAIQDMEASVADVERCLAQLRRVSGGLVAMRPQIERIGRVGVLLQSTAVGFAVESARTAECQQAFGSFVDDIRGLSGRTREIDGRISADADFIDAVTTNKTDFLREPQHFDHLARNLLPAFVAAGGHRPFKIWCAGCSTGEEPYTLAMYLSEFAEQNRGFSFSLFATDISTHVLRIAQEAVYAEDRIGPVPLAWRKKYLLRSRDPERPRVRIVPALRDRVRFARLNFMEEDYGVREVFDAIFFRNVMIYFARPTQELVVGRLCRQLRAGGHLYIGHSESLLGLDVPVRMVGSAIYRLPPADANE